MLLCRAWIVQLGVSLLGFALSAVCGCGCGRGRPKNDHLVPAVELQRDASRLSASLLRPGRRIVAGDTANVIYGGGYLYWVDANGIVRMAEGAETGERLVTQKRCGPLAFSHGALYWIHFDDDTNGVLSTSDVGTGKSRQLAKMRCWSTGGAHLAVFHDKILVGGSCEPELATVDVKGTVSTLTHPDERHPFEQRAPYREAIPAIASSNMGAAWISQYRVYLLGEDWRARLVWDRGLSTAIALSDTHLLWASGRTALDVDNGPTTIRSLDLQRRNTEVIVTGAGHVFSTQARGMKLYYTVEPDLLQVADMVTKTVKTLGKTLAGMNTVVLGNERIYVQVPQEGIFEFIE